MSSEIKINKPGFLDFLLAAGAGVATGAQKGLSARQQREATKAQQDILNQFTKERLSLEEEDIKSRERFQKQQIGVQGLGLLLQRREGALDRESRERIAEIRAGIGVEGKSETEIAKEKADLELVLQRIETASQGRELALAEEDRAERRTLVAERSSDLAFDIADSNKQFKLAELLFEMAKDELDIPERLYFEQAKINIERTAGQLSGADSAFVGYGMRAMEAAATTQDPRLVKIAQSVTPEINKIFKKHDLDMPNVKLEFRRSFRSLGRKRLEAVEGEPVQGPSQPLSLPFDLSQPQPSNLGQPPSIRDSGLFGMLSNILQGQAGTPIEQPQLLSDKDAPLIQRLLQERQPAQPVGNIPAPVLNRVVGDLKAAGVTFLSKEIKKEMKAAPPEGFGYSDAEIKFIEGQIK